MDKLKAMQTVVSIADTGSLTAATAEFGSSPPAVVRTLAALETYLGIRLFNRSTRRISLTEEGRHYLASCRQLLAAIKDAESALVSDTAEPAGPLTITAPMLFGQMFGMFISYQVAHAIEQNRKSYRHAPTADQCRLPHARLLPVSTKVFIEWIKQELKQLQCVA